MALSNCILLAGNDASTLNSIQQLIKGQQPNIDIVVCTPVEILQQVQKCSPLMVLFYSPNIGNRHAAYIKELRDNQAFDEIPLYVYASIPTAEDIKALLKNLT